MPEMLASVETMLVSVETMLASVETMLASVETMVASVKTMLASVKTMLASVETMLASVKTMLASVETLLPSVPEHLPTAKTQRRRTKPQLTACPGQRASDRSADEPARRSRLATPSIYKGKKTGVKVLPSFFQRYCFDYYHPLFARQASRRNLFRCNHIEECLGSAHTANRARIDLKKNFVGGWLP